MHARWLQLIESIPFTLVHKPGTSMGPADTLSRRSDLADPITGGSAIKGQARVLPDFPDNIELLMSEGQSCLSESIPRLVASVFSPSLLPSQFDSEMDFFLPAISSCVSFPVTTRGGGGKKSVIPTESKSTEDGHVVTSLDLETLVTSHIADHSDFLERLKLASLDDTLWYSKAMKHDTEFCFIANGLIQKVVNGRPLVYIPICMHEEVIRRHHDPVYCGHFATKKTYERILRAFWWPGLKKEVEDYCRSCPVCQRSKRTTQLPLGNPSPFNVPYRRFEIITMDEVSGFPMTERGNCKAWVFVDKLSKHLTVVPFSESVDAMAIARALLDRIVQNWGLPRKIVSDRDPRMAGEVYQTLCRLWNIRPNISSARSAQTDGQSESAVEVITELLRAFVNHNASDWDLLLPSMCFAYNDSVSPASGFSPLFILHGEHPASPVAMLARDLSAEISTGVRQVGVAEFVRRIGENIVRARIQLEKTRGQIEKQMASRVRPAEFSCGDMVLLHRFASGVVGKKLGKLGPRWLGPFKILEKRFDNAYRLDLPPVMGIEPVVNLRFLKRFYEANREDTTPLQLNVPISEFTRFRITPDSDNLYRAEFEIQTDPPGLVSGEWLTVSQCVASGFFSLLASYLSTLPDLLNPANHFLGREVLDWEFREKSFPGLVSSFDPTDSKSQYEIVYQDGDSRWIAKKHLLAVLVRPVSGLRKPKSKPKRSHSVVASMSITTPFSLKDDVQRILILFSGTDSVGCFFRKHMGSSVTVLNLDVSSDSPNAVHMDVLDWEFRKFPVGYFDFVWASPPCTEYSRAKTVGIRNIARADRLVLRVLEILRHLSPRYWIIENPLGLLRSREFMLPLARFRQTTSYCLHGSPFQKHTDLWSSHPLFPSLSICTPWNPCAQLEQLGHHFVSASSGPARGLHGSSIDQLHRIPNGLLEQLCRPYFSSLVSSSTTTDEDVFPLKM